MAMALRTSAWHLAALVLGLAIAVGGPATIRAGGLMQPAQSTSEAPTRAQRLDELFSFLKTAKSEDEGDAIVADIWKLWLQSSDPAVDGEMQRAIAVMAHGLPALALPILDDIVARAPGWSEGWNKRATVLFMMGEHDRSLADIDRVLALEPRHFGALAGIGLIRIAKGENREALAALRKALGYNPFLKERYGLIPALERELGEKPL